MARTRSPKGQLGDKDFEVLRAARWRWWQSATPQIEAGNSGSNVTVDVHGVYRTLRNAGCTDWNDPSQVSYRMRKLEKFGYLKSGWRGNYTPTDYADPYVGQMILEAKQREEAWSQAVARKMEGFTQRLDHLIPGHTLRVNQQTYAYRKEGLSALDVSIQGKVTHLEVLLRLAEKQLAAEEYAAEQAELNDVS